MSYGYRGPLAAEEGLIQWLAHGVLAEGQGIRLQPVQHQFDSGRRLSSYVLHFQR
jgi:hypothetical protein